MIFQLNNSAGESVGLVNVEDRPLKLTEEEMETKWEMYYHSNEYCLDIDEFVELLGTEHYDAERIFITEINP